VKERTSKKENDLSSKRKKKKKKKNKKKGRTWEENRPIGTIATRGCL
jgi:hypothetical protein